MPKQRVTGTYGGRIKEFEITVPDKSPMESPAQYASRILRTVADRMKAMGVTSWSQGYRTEASSHDAAALNQLIHSRAQDGQGPLSNLLSPIRPQKRKFQKYPRSR